MNGVDYKLFAYLTITLVMFLSWGCQPSTKKDAQQKNGSGMDMAGMDKAANDTGLSSLLKPTNGFVVSSLPTTTITSGEVAPVIYALGTVAYDTRQIGVISSRVAGRIDKVYVRYRYQKINKGQRIMDIYSPELLTDEENLLFLLKNDADNTSLINDAKERLLLLGMGAGQVQAVIDSHKPVNAISIFSNYSGHIHEAGADNANMNGGPAIMNDNSFTTEPLTVKEGTYVQKGQQVFSVYNPGKAWVLLNIYTDDQQAVKLGAPVHIYSETSPDKNFKGKINFIEPFFRKDSKTLTARVYFDNSLLQLPVGSQVKTAVYADKKNAFTLPSSAVVSLGTGKVVFIKVKGGFKTRKVITGDTYDNRIQILSGLSIKDSVAVNAQYLIDSESFIKVNDRP